MTPVYTFSQSPFDICNALVEVFSIGSGTIREHWSRYSKVILESVGWYALWKLSKQFCKKFGVRFPCAALIKVLSIDLESLTVKARVMRVQHEVKSIPRKVLNVPLIELWPTIEQRGHCEDIELIAEYVDLMRFFYYNIWMPWDDQDGKELSPKTVKNRMRLWVELHDGSMPSYVARSIIMMRESAINTYETFRDLDSSLYNSDMGYGYDFPLPSNCLMQYAVMYANLDSLMPKWSLFENPIFRNEYVVKAKKKWQENIGKRNVVALWQGGSVSDFNQISAHLGSRISNEQTLNVLHSAEEGLSLEPEEVIVCSSNYELPEMPLSQISLRSFNGATIDASEIRSCLLMMSDECKIQDLRLNCALVRTVIVMRAGSLHIKNCKFLNDTLIDYPNKFAQAIVAKREAKILVEDCTFENFYTAVIVYKGAKVELRNCAIRESELGVQMYSGSHVKLERTFISGCSEYSIRCEVRDNVDYKTGTDGLEVASNCMIGAGNLQQEVIVFQQDGGFI